MKKTKIVCTMGPGTNDPEIVRKLIREGMDIARFNFSHGTHEEQKARMDMIKRLREEEKIPVAAGKSRSRRGRCLHYVQRRLRETKQGFP